MRNRRSKFNVPHALPPDNRPRYFNAALVANDALVTDPSVFSAITFVILCWAENAFVKKAVFFGFLRSVIDGLGLRYLAMRPS